MEISTCPLSPLIGLDLDGLRQVAAEVGLKPFAARQMAAWIYPRRAAGFEQMTDLSKAAREKLARKWCVGREAPVARAISSDGTIKYLFHGTPGHDVEAVAIPDHDRTTLCVSSQAGCKMGCAFCMTGQQGFHGNLSASQIINQALSVPGSEALTNIVFMGMGEPTDNLPEVLRAIEIITAPWGLAWSPKRITVSTVGANLHTVKELLDLTKVHIAVSVHSPFHAHRASIMPAERARPIEDIIGLLRGYDFAHQRRLAVEYIMWGGTNDSMRHADALAQLLRGTDARVNIIPFHLIPGSELRPATRNTMEAFRDRLNSLGITATIRTSRGQDIDAACGMLAGKHKVQPNQQHNV